MGQYHRALVLAIVCTSKVGWADDPVPTEPVDIPATPTPPAVVPPSEVAPPPPDPAMRKRMKELEDRLDQVEKQSSLQRLQWSGDYRTTLGSYWYHGVAPDSNPVPPPGTVPEVVDLRSGEQWLHRVRLMIKAEPSANLRMRARASVFKRFGTNTTTPAPQDFSQGRVPSDTTLRLDRFWLDWFVTPRVALSFGRISYSNGSPGELRENLEQPDATWGLTMVDGEFETVDVTAQIHKQFLVRGFYASWAFPRNDDLFSSSLFLDNGTKNLRIVGGNADVTSPDGRWFAQLGYYHVPKFRPFDIPLPNPFFYNNPAGNPTNAPPPLDGSLVFPSNKPDSLGSYSNLSLFLMMKKVAGFDAFVGGALGFLRPNGKGISYRGYAFDQMGMPIFDPSGLPAELELLQLVGADEDADRTTTFLYLGGRWTAPAGGVYAPRFGLEYNQASRYAISFAQSTDLLTNKLAVRGKAWEAYYIQPIHELAFLRLDYQYIDAEYTSGFPGNMAGATGFFGVPDLPFLPPHGGTSPPVAPGGQRLHALTASLHTNF